MYYTDSLAREIYLYDFDRQSKSLQNRRLFVKTAEADGLPDGPTIDAQDTCGPRGWMDIA